MPSEQPSKLRKLTNDERAHLRRPMPVSNVANKDILHANAPPRPITRTRIVSRPEYLCWSTPSRKNTHDISIASLDASMISVINKPTNLITTSVTSNILYTKNLASCTNPTPEILKNPISRPLWHRPLLTSMTICHTQEPIH